MTETPCFPESFDEVVWLILKGQMEAAGILWDGRTQRMAQDSTEGMSNYNLRGEE